MAKDNRVRMPSSMGGLASYYEDYKSRLGIPPTYVIIGIVIVIFVLISMHAFGSQWLNGMAIP